MDIRRGDPAWSPASVTLDPVRGCAERKNLLPSADDKLYSDFASGCSFFVPKNREKGEIDSAALLNGTDNFLYPKRGRWTNLVLSLDKAS